MTARIVSRWLVPGIFLPLSLLAQTPPEVDQALRARVTEFMQLHVDGNFRKAYDMVAEDTKEDYFNAGKARLVSFKINDIQFTDNFTRATVSATISKTISIMGTNLLMPMPSNSTWKIESGKWVWYNDPQSAWVTPLGPAGAPQGTAAAANGGNDAPVTLPKDFDEKAVAAAARSILQQVSVDKKEITLATDKASEEKVMFHNGMTGSVQVQLTVPEISGFTAKIENRMVKAAADVPVVFRYEPNQISGQPARRDPVDVQFTVEPLNQIFVIRVNFAGPGPLIPK